METKGYGELKILTEGENKLYLFESEGYCTGDFDSFKEFLEDRGYKKLSKKISDITGNEFVTEVISSESSKRMKDYMGKGDCVRVTSPKGMTSIPYKEKDNFKVTDYVFYHLDGKIYDGPNNLEYDYSDFSKRLIKDNKFNICIETV
ncbi:MULTISPECIES: hypothetical protein [Clostridium]|uniref:hypothetical protein n=1 Tax=Clostridium TaxID=1485 RepID=UPI0021535275|nr:hypothetical protein [Clostridium sp. LY3-2]MCR6516058.1 hypothetical protein [Clostridium sp. LY3-2]